MKYKCRFLAHEIYNKCKEETIDGNPVLEKSLNKKIEQIRQDPLSGTTMKYMPKPLSGMIRKFKIGGRKGHSLCYIYFKNLGIAVGVYITPELRKDLDYDKFPVDVFIEAKKDFDAKNMSKFNVVE